MVCIQVSTFNTLSSLQYLLNSPILKLELLIKVLNPSTPNITMWRGLLQILKSVAFIDLIQCHDIFIDLPFIRSICSQSQDIPVAPDRKLVKKCSTLIEIIKIRTSSSEWMFFLFHFKVSVKSDCFTDLRKTRDTCFTRNVCVLHLKYIKEKSCTREVAEKLNFHSLRLYIIWRKKNIEWCKVLPLKKETKNGNQRFPQFSLMSQQ